MSLQVVPEYKIILLGELGVGKTTFFLRIKQGEFVDTQKQSECLDHLLYKTTVDGTEVKVHLFDTAGGERYRTLTSNYYMNSDAAILMFSVDDNYSFERLQDDIDNTLRFVDPDNYVWAVMGNKCDLPMEVDPQRVTDRCTFLETELSFYVSAKTGENIVPALDKVIKHVHQKRKERHHQSGKTSSFKIDPASKSRSNCC